MSIHQLLAADKHISDAVLRAFCEQTHTSPAPPVRKPSPFESLISNLERARADAASMVGRMTEMDSVHAMIDEVLEYARAECFAVERGDETC